MIPDDKKYHFLNTIQILSLDVVAGTLAVGYMAIRLLNVTPVPQWWVILPLAVWVVYSLDHIIDSAKNKGEAVIYRHRFHYLYRKQIIFVLILTGLITASLSLMYLDRQIIILGLGLSIFIAIYFALIYFLKLKKTVFLQKELIIAFVYTSGIFIAPLYWYEALPSFSVIIIIFIIFLIAWFEGILISWFDNDNDIMDGHTSFTVIVGKRNTRRFLIVGHMFVEILIVVVLIMIPVSIIFYALLITLIMNFILAMIIMFPESFARNNYYRLIGETVFLLPFSIILVS